MAAPQGSAPISASACFSQDVMPIARYIATAVRRYSCACRVGPCGGRACRGRGGSAQRAGASRAARRVPMPCDNEPRRARHRSNRDGSRRRRAGAARGRSTRPDAGEAFDSTLAQAPRVVELAERQRGPTQPQIAPSESTDVSALRDDARQVAHLPAADSGPRSSRRAAPGPWQKTRPLRKARGRSWLL